MDDPVPVSLEIGARSAHLVARRGVIFSRPVAEAGGKAIGAAGLAAKFAAAMRQRVSGKGSFVRHVCSDRLRECCAQREQKGNFAMECGQTVSGRARPTAFLQKKRTFELAEKLI